MLKGLEVFFDDCHVEVFDAKLDSLEVNRFDVFEVNDEERELADSNQTVFSRSDLDDCFLRATLECKFFDWNVELNWEGGLFALGLDHLREIEEFLAEFLFSLSLLLFLLQLIKIVSSTAAFHIDVVCCNARFFEKLDICDFLVA